VPSILDRIRYRLWAAPRTLREADQALLFAGTLRQAGWLRSARLRAPVDGAGRPVPWYTYPALAWLGGVLRGTEAVFEYGAGNSTLWYAARAATVRSVEHDPQWVDRLQPALPSNAVVVHRARDEDPGTSPYITAIREDGGPFDLIAVDGRDRVACMLEASRHLRDGGLLVVDDAERVRYAPGLRELAELGFRRIDFVGPTVGGLGMRCTSVLSKRVEAWLPGDRMPAPAPPVMERRPWSP
jgi:hypothetical protein